MKKLHGLYIAGLVSIGLLLAFASFQFLIKPTKTSNPEVEHLSVEIDQSYKISFSINNIWDKEQVYTIAILRNDEKTGESSYTVGVNRTFKYTTYIEPSSEEGDRINVLIYRGEERELIDNVTYILIPKERIPRKPEKTELEKLEEINCYSDPILVSPFSHKNVRVYSLGAPSLNHNALPVFRENINHTISYIRFDAHGDEETFESQPQYRTKFLEIWRKHPESSYNFTTVDRISGLYNESYLNCGSYMLQIYTDENVKDVFWLSTGKTQERVDYIVAKSIWSQEEKEIFSTSYEVHIFPTFEDASTFMLRNSEKNIVIDIDGDITKGYPTSYGTGDLTSNQLKEFISKAFELRDIEYIVVAGDMNFTMGILN